MYHKMARKLQLKVLTSFDLQNKIGFAPDSLSIQCREGREKENSHVPRRSLPLVIGTVMPTYQSGISVKR